ncbi:TetR/AcrR family transcriptional regulator [Spirosoma validum]|uniref:TetR/AcrR family transcriptional regulator n=1 Tax=Spirosoma validum TaxID=2771355 RepID=A0A927B4X5_9BACT|nr:TetR/AcrR family transcriptional regulator [Spirosoma validum]MBD2755719.1 TetR/AcrR family transcriptional regulator [Spirosoma validum]
MKNEQLTTGRINQKLETRHKILDTAQKLLETKALFSLEDVAQAMGISRATIYRYYSTIDLLCAEAALAFRVKQPDDFLADIKGMTLSESLLYVQDYFNKHAEIHELAFRKYLSVVLNESVKKGQSAQLRGARRPAVLEAVMQPHTQRIGVQNYDRLKQIISALSGIEPMIANKDVNGLTNEESNKLLSWALEMILKGMELDRA